MQIYIWAGVFVSLGLASGKYLLTENYIKISFLRTLIGMVVNIILNIILIPKIGINGAAIATLISYFLSPFSLGFIPKTSKQAVLMLKSINLLNIFSDRYKESVK